jgi:hypothetical protein
MGLCVDNGHSDASTVYISFSTWVDCYMKNVFSETGVKVPIKFGNFQVGNALGNSLEGPCSRELPRFFAPSPRPRHG